MWQNCLLSGGSFKSKYMGFLLSRYRSCFVLKPHVPCKPLYLLTDSVGIHSRVPMPRESLYSGEAQSIASPSCIYIYIFFIVKMQFINWRSLISWALLPSDLVDIPLFFFFKVTGVREQNIINSQDLRRKAFLSPWSLVMVWCQEVAGQGRGGGGELWFFSVIQGKNPCLISK